MTHQKNEQVKKRNNMELNILYNIIFKCDYMKIFILFILIYTRIIEFIHNLFMNFSRVMFDLEFIITSILRPSSIKTPEYFTS